MMLLDRFVAADREEAMARVFISHASRDRELADELHGWLIQEGHEVFLDHHPDQGITVGEAWEQRLYERLRWADAMICVVTSAYLASPWCAAEVGIARSQGSRLLPLLAERGVEYPLLEWSQYADLVSDPVAARAALAAALRRVDVVGGWGWPDGRSPFPGLRSFDVDQHRVFFGRAAEVQTLAGLLRSPAERAGGGVLLVVGPSGCGKSSLVRAGLVPVMAAEPGWWTLSPFLPGADPVAALGRELAAAARQVGLGWTLAQVRERLGDGRLGEVADELLLAVPGGSRRRRLLVVVDQFEELLTQAAPAARAHFAELLRPALDNPIQVVATLRPEFLAQLLASSELAGLPTRVFTLRPLRRDALATVIKGPARLAGIGVDDELVDRLVGDTDTGEALPLLAFALEQLSDGVGRGGQLSAARYEQLGGVQGALVRQADAALADACAASGRSADEAIGGLLRLVTVDEHGRPTRWRVDRDELSGPALSELDPFIARRLLSTDTDNGTVVVGVTHEAFLSAWPPLAAAITAAVSALRMRGAVEQAAAEWNANGRPTTRLWERGQLAAAVNDTGARIQQASRSGDLPPAGTRSWRERLSGWLPGGHRVLVTDKVELSQQARTFLHTSIRVDRRRRRRATTILSVLLVFALVSAGVAIQQQSFAQQQAARRQEEARRAEDAAALATSRQLAAAATSSVQTRLDRSMLLSLEAIRARDTPEARSALLTGLEHSPQITSFLHSDLGATNAVTFSPDGKLLASATSGRAVILWDVAMRRRRAVLMGSRDELTSVAFSPDGHTLASGSTDNTIIVWDVASGRRRAVLAGHRDAVLSVAFRLDGKTLASGSADKTVMLWDVASRRRLDVLAGHRMAVSSVAFSPRGDILASGSYDATVAIWDVATGRRRAVLAGHRYEVSSVAFSPDGHTLASGSADNTAVLWDIASRRRRGEPLTGHSAFVTAVAFSPDGKTLVSGGADKRLIVWRLGTRPPTRERLIGHEARVTGVDFGANGDTMASSSDDGTVVLWNLRRSTRLAEPLVGHRDRVRGLAFSPDGKLLASGSADKTVILWDVANRRRMHQLARHTDRVRTVAFSPDGKLLASGSDDKTVILWDVATQRPIGQPMREHRDGVESLAFSPNGRLLASGSLDGRLIIWDLASNRPLGTPLAAHKASITAVTFSPDGNLIASTAYDQQVLLWDTVTRRQVGKPLMVPDAGTSLAFSPDGRTLAAGAVGSTVLLWDVATRRLLGEPLAGHSDAVASVSFSPDGRVLASGGSDARMILWDVASRRPLGKPLSVASTGRLTSVAFSPAGSILASGGLGGTVVLWDTDIVSWQTRACGLANRSLTREEWDRFVGRERPYARSCPS
jgi:WD40 repeat protein